MSYHHPQAPSHYPPAASHYPPGAPAAGAPPQQQHLGDPGPHPSSPDSPTTSSSRKRARPAEMDALAATEDSAGYKDYYATQPPSAQGYYDTSGGAPPQSATDLGSQVGTDNGGFAIEHGDGEGDDDDEDETPARRNTDSTKAGRRKIKIEFIQDKSRRHITFSKRKAGIMKK
ncbi:transcription factor of the MADS box, partial [Tulasnella sp. 408]